MHYWRTKRRHRTLMKRFVMRWLVVGAAPDTLPADKESPDGPRHPLPKRATPRQKRRKRGGGADGLCSEWLEDRVCVYGKYELYSSRLRVERVRRLIVPIGAKIRTDPQASTLSEHTHMHKHRSTHTHTRTCRHT